MSSFADETRFDDPGTLRKPGPIGRSVRLLLGLWLLYVCWFLWTYPGALVSKAIPYWTALLSIAFALWLIPPVVNIGFGTDWRAWPRYVVTGVILLWAIGLALSAGSWWSPALGRFAWLFVLYTFGHLGLSFVLAAAIATPGCEMRALPHLWTLLTGRKTKEHFCPGFLHELDAWETQRATRSG
ncbi:MAG: hypothetical protein O7A98_00420 [Acidobacteria bacterium]|nr:hypothetical protein [Acidobacteriota bacterium]